MREEVDLKEQVLSVTSCNCFYLIFYLYLGNNMEKHAIFWKNSYFLSGYIDVQSVIMLEVHLFVNEHSVC